MSEHKAAEAFYLEEGGWPTWLKRGHKSPGRRAVRDAHAGRIVWRSRIMTRVDGLLQTVGVQTYVKPPHPPFYEHGVLRSVPNLGGVPTTRAKS